MKFLSKVLVGAITDVIITCNVLLIVDLVSTSVEYYKEKKEKKARNRKWRLLRI